MRYWKAKQRLSSYVHPPQGSRETYLEKAGEISNDLEGVRQDGMIFDGEERDTASEARDALRDQSARDDELRSVLRKSLKSLSQARDVPVGRRC